MGGLHSLRDRIVDGPGSLGERKRARRWDWLVDAFPEIRSMSVIDLGGTVEAWLRSPVHPALVHVVNLEEPPREVPAWIRADQADACRLPSRISDSSYDLVFSNSVIEHVGGHAQRMRFADAVHKLAERHWVQTPYRYFPIEPHWLFPGFQFLPLAARAELSRRWPLVHTKSSSWQEGMSAAMSVELLSRAEMAFYFPDSTLRFERMLGAAKSLIAAKNAHSERWSDQLAGSRSRAARAVQSP
jgi:Methyltransferase domain